MTLLLSILTFKDLDTMFSTRFFHIKVIATIKKLCQILNDEKL